MAVADDPLYESLFQAYDDLLARRWDGGTTTRSKRVGFITLPNGRVGQVTITIETNEETWH